MKALLLILSLLAHLPTWADGEQRHMEKGTTWVNPVEFYHLQDINRTDFQRDYDQGDIDFNKVVREKGVKVYGLRLKPIAGAMRVRKFMNIGYDEDFVSATLSYQDLYGIEGVPLHEASFCVYFDETVSRTYSFDYTYSVKANIDGESSTDHGSSTSSISISGLRLVANGDGVAFSYALTCKGKEREHTSGSESMQGSLTASDVLTKPNCVDERLGHFIYFSGGRYLLAMLAATAKATADKAKEMDLIPSERELMSNHPWPRVYFIVEEILVDAGAAAAEEAAITGKDPEDVEGSEGLTNEDKTELMEYMEDLVAWLGGEGDPFGFGERTDENTAAVINTIATVSSILLGTGLAGVFGGTGASIAGGMTEAILSGAGGGVPPTMPEPPQIDGLEPKRPEEGEGKEDYPPPPPEKKPDFFGKYTRTDADGDIYVRDPVTGKETLYINNGDGTYRNFNTDQNWSRDEINENLRYRNENLGLLKQDADQAARNAQEQHQQWVAQNERDIARGYSDEMMDFRNWVAQQEAAERKQEKIEELAIKYKVAPTEKAVKDAIKWEQLMNQMDSDTYRAEADAWDEKITYLETVDKTCEITVNIMGSCVPGGEVVKNAYTFAKSTLVATSEAIAEGKSTGKAVAHVLVGMGNGALGVIQNQASDLAGNGKLAWAKELGINVLTEDLKEGMNAIAEGKSVEEIGRILISTTGSKTAEFGVGKLISGGLSKLGQRATDSLDATKVATMADHNKIIFDTSSAKTLDNLLNKTHRFGVGPELKTFNISVGPKGFNVWKGKGFAFSGKIKAGALTEAIIGETVSNTVGYDWGGDLATGVSNWGATKAGEVAYGLGKLGEALGGSAVVSSGGSFSADEIQKFAGNIGKFNDMAATFRKR